MDKYKPPSIGEIITSKPKIFLAGSIEMGKAVDWQKTVEDELSNYDVVIYNPRRDDWDSSWEQNISNDQFRHQVTWELRHLEVSDMIIMYLAGDTISPISLLELGMYARTNKLVVCCPDEFHRKGNVDVVCARYGVPLYEDFNKFLGYIKLRIENDYLD